MIDTQAERTLLATRIDLANGKSNPEAALAYINEQREIAKKLTQAMRSADEVFKVSGGSTRHYINECLLPAIAEVGLCVIKKQ